MKPYMYSIKLRVDKEDMVMDFFHLGQQNILYLCILCVDIVTLETRYISLICFHLSLKSAIEVRLVHLLHFWPSNITEPTHRRGFQNINCKTSALSRRLQTTQFDAKKADNFAKTHEEMLHSLNHFDQQLTAKFTVNRTQPALNAYLAFPSP